MPIPSRRASSENRGGWAASASVAHLGVAVFGRDEVERLHAELLKTSWEAEGDEDRGVSPD